MAWLSAEQLKARVGEDRINDLSDLSHDGQPDAGVIATAITDAEGRVESKLRRRYTAAELATIDTTTAPGNKLARIVAQLALYYLTSRRFSVVPSDVLRLRDDSISELTDILKGDSVLLPGSSTTDSPASVASRSRTTRGGDDVDFDRMTLANMEDW